ncbi:DEOXYGUANOSINE KINASE (DGUO KINASE) (DGK) (DEOXYNUCLEOSIDE KINASE COMPLEX I F-COMPONENT) [Mycoplasmopsis pulmonis]|uniref:DEOXYGUANOSINE KINASE (DGUO KINASE) (DGK) (DEOXYNUCLEOSIDE KINASE COMPLEX I F-COMPONENT) n=1 Tax=Mycoplasmopsis pulmonis (strain UAB CTIP) TaxID=272635 RepID=Q98Q17_MYCPU|nr:deoxynucleoside kinase [Mycoplasmopsis pulmonis]MDZ7293644.1 deoxynucleoside kinase [Mycoplasmopsis pulmonis]CAC13725.1 DEOXYGUANOSINE KINASE (DGUO KINASE) (DGK) (DEOXYNUCLEOSIDE KINASE COMPLEX I F-COMPONENT) [Mycoplasmopsis pulmonis]VEU68317.1 Deoxyguanosine kinase [Mycoplasmopsis pulmonis]
MVIGISGMISTGKSTLVESLKNTYPTSLHLVEFEEDDEVFNTFLRWFYEKKENLTIGFQSYIVENHSSKFEKILSIFENEHLDPKKDFIFLDRFSVEHYIFAHVNLQSKAPYYLEAYDAMFDVIIRGNEIPDHAIFLDCSFEVFKQRLFSRGRDVEINNWEKNKNYFEILHAVYKPLFIKLCTKYNIPYTIIETDKLSADQTLAKAKEILENLKRS